MTHFKPGDKVILVEGDYDVRDYLYEVVNHFPKDIVVIQRSALNPEITETFEYSVPSKDLIYAEESGWELLPTLLEDYAGTQVFYDHLWRDVESGYRNAINGFPVRRRINDAEDT